jgi:predicted acylesterase/phospholipase RssA
VAVPETELEGVPPGEEARAAELWSAEPAIAPAGRLGLALSGGGFRAAFFHLGVLVQMARLGLLHQVEVISTVSGGSVIGALYYLHLRELLQSKPDAGIRGDDYLRLLLRIETDFVAAVQKNIRMRTFSNPLKNIRMALSASYSRSDRIGELYDRFIYRPVTGVDRPLELRELKIQPPDGPEGFHPLRHNEPRTNKVPVLLLNATTLNTGHNWRFEASRMGSPPRREPAAREVDRTTRLCTPETYADLPPHQQDFPLGIAVAASTCVPGLFPPLAVSGVYEGIRVQLVDGGLHDNQGVAGLVDLECERFVVSDAGGQLGFAPEPSTGFLGVASRSNSVLMQRVREEQLFRMMERGAPTAFMHLRRGLPIEVHPWLGPDGNPVDREECHPWPDEGSSEFGIDARVQERLAAVRTDLDSFSETEALTLIHDGFQMSEPRLRPLAGGSEPAADQGWRFRAAADQARDPQPGFLRHLAVASSRFGKVFGLSTPMKWFLLVVAAAVIVLAVIGLWNVTAALPSRRIPLGPLLLGIAILVVLLVAPHLNTMLLPVRKAAELILGVVRGLLLALTAGLVWIHLLTLDRLFLRLGRIDRWPGGGAGGTPSG